MENKNAETDNIIALCHIIDDFEEFEKKLTPMISHKYNRNFVIQLYDISKGKFKLGARKAKKFYSENKGVIDIINKYSNIASFINENYGCYGKPNETLQFFYEYISSHKEKIKQILDVLEKLNDLGFWEFEFNENLDFTKEIYNITFRENTCLTYVANAKVIPSYENLINYKTTDSNYKMKLNIVGEEISKYGSKIELNSLLFDKETLPACINKENTFEYILRLNSEQKEQHIIIRNSVDLSISILNLKNELNSTSEIVNRLYKVKNKDELIAILLKIREDVEKLKVLSREYDSNISEQVPLLTPEILEKEKALHLKRRYWSILDID